MVKDSDRRGLGQDRFKKKTAQGQGLRVRVIKHRGYIIIGALDQ